MQPTSVQKQKNNPNIGGIKMIQTMKKRIKNEKGLTLIELLAVIVILAIVAAIAIPAIGGIIDNSRYKAVKSDAINVLNAANIYYTDNDSATGPVSVKDLKDASFLKTDGEIPEDATVTKDLELTTGEFDYGGKNKINFSNATVELINAHTDKTEPLVGTATP